jgi:hypothetical protein
MEISPSQLLSALASSPQTRSLDHLQSGQVITATVSRIISSELAEIRIGQAVVQAKLTEVLQEGQQLKLQVQRSGDITQLKVIEQAVTKTDTLTDALRTAIPRQTALAPVLSRLVQLATNASEKSAELSNESRTLIKTLIDSLPTQQSVRQPVNVQQAVRQSGILLEHTLQGANTSQTDIASALKADLKAQLLRIAASLKQAAASGTSPAQQTATTGKSAQGTATGTSTPASVTTTTAGATGNSPGQSNAATTAAAKPDTPVPVNQQATAATSEKANPAATRLAAGQTPLPDAPAKDAPRTLQTGALPPVDASQAEADAGKTQQLLHTHYAANKQAGAGSPASQRADLLNAVLHNKNLADDVDAAVARIQMHQLNTIHTDDSNRPALILELPVQNQEKVDSFQLRIEQDEHTGDVPPHERLWRVSLDFNLEQLGRCYAIITVRNEHVTTDLWSENENTTQLFSQHSELLNAALASAGLSVTRVQCHTGNPPSTTLTTHKSLLNIKV